MLAGGLTILKGSPNSTELRAGGAMVMEATSGVTALYVDGVPALRANHNGQTGITLFNPNTGYTAFESSYYTNTKIYAPNNDVRISISADKTSIMRPVTGGDAIEIDEWNLRLRTANGNTVFYTYDGELVMYQPTGGGDVLRANIGSVSIFSPSKDAGLSITKDATYLSSVGMVQLNAGSGRSYFKLDEIDTRLIAYTNLYIKSYGQMTVDSNVILIPSIPSSGKFPMNFLTQFPESGQVVKSSIEDAKWMLSINGIYPLANGIRYSSGVSDGLGIEMESGIMRYTTLATDLEIYMPKLPRAVEGGVYSVMLAGENDGALKKASLEEIGERIGFSDHISEDLLRWQSILDDRSKQWEAIEALQNKTTSGSTPEDMLTTSETDAGYIVANALGGVVTYKTKAVLGLLLGSGTLTINGVQEDKGLTLIGGVSGTKVVKDGDKVQSSNMESLTFTPYIAA